MNHFSPFHNKKLMDFSGFFRFFQVEMGVLGHYKKRKLLILSNWKGKIFDRILQIRELEGVALITGEYQGLRLDMK
ncbi:MAG: hypothetical protein BWY23_02769 [Spirochaetes bacterium ADurb.Bin218]|nr:MAG: hypothetical protein BWY23_02769 [Spirochaetes bacterium ADurb.Bin218]